ncbi:MAG: hypothetical protein HYV27_15170 [Candidatus Hydrogenedentes bacterium]|nr:hypothetical protein [Candidatus Hydrogenedentota bacterium]
MISGAFRYGRLGAEDKPGYDRVGSAVARLERYRLDGNLEHLVDVANMMLVEFVEGEHPGRHWAAGDDGTHAEVVGR